MKRQVIRSASEAAAGVLKTAETASQQRFQDDQTLAKSNASPARNALSTTFARARHAQLGGIPNRLSEACGNLRNPYPDWVCAALS
jgi:hypothetical protein